MGGTLHTAQAIVHVRIHAIAARCCRWTATIQTQPSWRCGDTANTTINAAQDDTGSVLKYTMRSGVTGADENPLYALTSRDYKHHT